MPPARIGSPCLPVEEKVGEVGQDGAPLQLTSGCPSHVAQVPAVLFGCPTTLVLIALRHIMRR